ncbi:putative bifunctional diguanylate cyclase/phosphodiesterase [Methylobacterium nigriterrae]|uniref:putative bifunctional diguanylate cyclase/phosphodiesterase n=1 Tax=Methylobacterium nigriterrae TaxID=3127512 RepID=UPI003013ABB0
MLGIRSNEAEFGADDREAARLASLARCVILGTPPEAAFDRLAELAADMLGTPCAAISFIDGERQWLKASVGFGDLTDFPRADGLCDHVIATGGVLTLRDASADPRFRSRQAVAGPLALRFYAGAPLVTRSGYRLGVLCVADTRPRPALRPAARARLQRLAALTMDAVANRRRELSRRDAVGFVNATRSALIITDVRGVITFVNPACEALLGYAPGELAGLEVSRIVPGRLRGLHEAGFAAMAAGGSSRLAGKAVELMALRRDGAEVAVELTLASWGAGPDMGVGAVLRDISERRARDARLLRLAHQDARTGLPNRVRLSEEIDALAAEGRPAALLAIAIDGLHTVNGAFGYGTGDALLEALVLRLTGRLPHGPCTARSAAMLARLGGDELAVLLPGVADTEAVQAWAGRLLSAFAEPFPVGDHILHVGACIGAALVPTQGGDAVDVLVNADLALDGAKRDGARCYRMFEPAMRSAAAARRALQDDLLRAMERREIELHYQPQVDLASGEIQGVEALIRWRHPERGLLPPSEFLPAIESSALAFRVGWWTIDEACRQAAAWRKAGMPRIGMAVNLFAAQVRAGTLADVVTEALERHGLPPEALELEVTEVIALLDDETRINPLRRLHERGVRIALDDFGTGYASLSTLKNFPLSKLKIDRSFVRDLLTDAHDAAIVKAVLDIGRSLHLAVVAEGIETSEQEAALVGMGCRFGQGYRYGRALPAERLGLRLTEGAARVADVLSRVA